MRGEQKSSPRLNAPLGGRNRQCEKLALLDRYLVHTFSCRGYGAFTEGNEVPDGDTVCDNFRWVKPENFLRNEIMYSDIFSTSGAYDTLIKAFSRGTLS